MITSWPYPGSNTVVCSMGKHGRCKGNCSCDCHLQSPRLGRYGSRQPRNNRVVKKFPRVGVALLKGESLS